MKKERLARIRNFQSKEFYAAFFMRPLSIAVMWVIADWSWLTPNLLTLLANLAKLGAVALILTDLDAYLISVVVLLQLGLLFDHLDGTVARYRQCGSGFGSFYDKVSDGITWFLIIMALGWVAFEKTNDGLLLVLAAASTYALLVGGYMKWVVEAEANRLKWFQARNDPASAVDRETTPNPPAPPPERTPGEWMRWGLQRFAEIVKFEEVDLFLWVALFLLLDKLEALIWFLGVTQVFVMLVMVTKRALQIRGIDRELRDNRLEGDPQ